MDRTWNMLPVGERPSAVIDDGVAGQCAYWNETSTGLAAFSFNLSSWIVADSWETVTPEMPLGRLLNRMELGWINV
jgi:hypothetical protein